MYIHDLMNRARELAVYDLRAFYRSPVFRNNGFVVDELRGVISKTYYH